jgi:phosphoribosyl 1,2-cyclic phosphate phosphodiesterase
MHADHVHGIDDLRVFTGRRGDLPAYVPAEYEAHIARYFEYIFDDDVRAPEGSVKPRIHIHTTRPGEPVEILGRAFVPVEVPHGAVSAYGFRVGSLGYVTDGKSLPAAALETLRGVDVLVLNALWFGRPHPTHFNVEEAVDAARTLGATRTYLTHLTHRVTHRELEERLPDGVHAAYDGLTIELETGA